MAIVISFILIAVIAFGLWYFERILARKPNPQLGLIMPVGSLIVSVVAMIGVIPALFENLETLGITGIVADLALSFVFSNLATIWLYIVYFFTRKKMGERPWPLRPKQSAEESNTEATEENH